MNKWEESSRLDEERERKMMREVLRAGGGGGRNMELIKCGGGEKEGEKRYMRRT